MAADFVESKPLHKLPYKSGRDILDGQYKGGRSVIERNEWARAAFDDLRRRCAHVPEEDLVRLFHDRSQSQLELIQGAAVFHEYNATHLPGQRRHRQKLKLPKPSMPPATPGKPSSARPSRPSPAPRPSAKKTSAARRSQVRPARSAARKASKAKARRRR
jgi:hypothetical protein